MDTRIRKDATKKKVLRKKPVTPIAGVDEQWRKLEADHGDKERRKKRAREVMAAKHTQRRVQADQKFEAAIAKAKRLDHIAHHKQEQRRRQKRLVLPLNVRAEVAAGCPRPVRIIRPSLTFFPTTEDKRGWVLPQAFGSKMHGRYLRANGFVKDEQGGTIIEFKRGRITVPRLGDIGVLLNHAAYSPPKGQKSGAGTGSCLIADLMAPTKVQLALVKLNLTGALLVIDIRGVETIELEEEEEEEEEEKDDEEDEEEEEEVVVVVDEAGMELNDLAEKVEVMTVHRSSRGDGAGPQALSALDFFAGGADDGDWGADVLSVDTKAALMNSHALEPGAGALLGAPIVGKTLMGMGPLSMSMGPFSLASSPITLAATATDSAGAAEATLVCCEIHGLMFCRDCTSQETNAVSAIVAAGLEGYVEVPVLGGMPSSPKSRTVSKAKRRMNARGPKRRRRRRRKARAQGQVGAGGGEGEGAGTDEEDDSSTDDDEHDFWEYEDEEEGNALHLTGNEEVEEGYVGEEGYVRLGKTPQSQRKRLDGVRPTRLRLDPQIELAKRLGRMPSRLELVASRGSPVALERFLMSRGNQLRSDPILAIISKPAAVAEVAAKVAYSAAALSVMVVGKLMTQLAAAAAVGAAGAARQAVADLPKLPAPGSFEAFLALQQLVSNAANTIQASIRAKKARHLRAKLAMAKAAAVATSAASAACTADEVAAHALTKIKQPAADLGGSFESFLILQQVVQRAACTLQAGFRGKKARRAVATKRRIREMRINAQRQRQAALSKSKQEPKAKHGTEQTQGEQATNDEASSPTLKIVGVSPDSRKISSRGSNRSSVASRGSDGGTEALKEQFREEQRKTMKKAPTRGGPSGEGPVAMRRSRTKAAEQQRQDAKRQEAKRVAGAAKAAVAAAAIPPPPIPPPTVASAEGPASVVTAAAIPPPPPQSKPMQKASEERGRAKVSVQVQIRAACAIQSIFRGKRGRKAVGIRRRMKQRKAQALQKRKDGAARSPAVNTTSTAQHIQKSESESESERNIQSEIKVEKGTAGGKSSGERPTEKVRRQQENPGVQKQEEKKDKRSTVEQQKEKQDNALKEAHEKVARLKEQLGSSDEEEEEEEEEQSQDESDDSDESDSGGPFGGKPVASLSKNRKKNGKRNSRKGAPKERVGKTTESSRQTTESSTESSTGSSRLARLRNAADKTDRSRSRAASSSLSDSEGIEPRKRKANGSKQRQDKGSVESAQHPTNAETKSERRNSSGKSANSKREETPAANSPEGKSTRAATKRAAAAAINAARAAISSTQDLQKAIKVMKQKKHPRYQMALIQEMQFQKEHDAQKPKARNGRSDVLWWWQQKGAKRAKEEAEKEETARTVAAAEALELQQQRNSKRPAASDNEGARREGRRKHKTGAASSSGAGAGASALD
jgi:hypothetical protein